MLYGFQTVARREEHRARRTILSACAVGLVLVLTVFLTSREGSDGRRNELLYTYAVRRRTRCNIFPIIMTCLDVFFIVVGLTFYAFFFSQEGYAAPSLSSDVGSAYYPYAYASAVSPYVASPATDVDPYALAYSNPAYSAYASQAYPAAVTSQYPAALLRVSLTVPTCMQRFKHTWLRRLEAQK
jgi:hypothetical protein